MEALKEIKDRINSVRETQKITDAMYRIASAKMRRAKKELDGTRPYFEAVKGEIKRVFRTSSTVENRYFYPPTGEHELPGAYGYLVITADKGLAGSYNQSVLAEALRQMQTHEKNELFVVGEYGRRFFQKRHIPIEQSFLYTAQNPTLERAREIAGLLLERFRSGELGKIFIIYTDLGKQLHEQVCTVRLLPFHRADFAASENESTAETPFVFEPDISRVLDSIVPGYVTGFLYSALVDSFCCEQTARMTAMDNAVRSADELLDKLSGAYQHIRQSAITREITEISSGANAMLNAERAEFAKGEDGT